MIRRLISRLKHLLRSADFRQHLDEEMAFHIERLTEDLIRAGMDPGEARREARLRFGSTERVQARAREERGLALLDETARHVRLALRGMRRSPLFAGTFLATLALCIGLATAVFGVVDAVLWRPLPYPAPDRLANAALYNPSFGKSPFQVGINGRTWERIRDDGDPFARAVYSEAGRGVNLTTEEAAAFVTQQRVGAGYFGVLGVPPLLGREFEAAEDVPDGPPVAILGHDLWTRTFGGSPEILGETIRLKGEAHTVVGIMPPDFRSGAEADVWTPLRASTTGEGSGINYAAVVRIPEGMSFQEADARFAGIEPPLSTRDDAPDRRFGLVPFDAAETAGVRLPMLVLLGAVGLLLVVGCANLAGLQIARSLARRAEMATRQALGSGSGALVRQLVVENLLLGVVGGLAGLAVAHFGVEVLEGPVRSHFGIWQDVRIDGRALAAAAAITVFATLLFGLAPVAQARRPGVYRVLVSGSRVVGGGGHALRKLLLVGQVAVVTALLFAAGLLVRSHGHLRGLDPGFDPEDVLAVQFSLDDARYAEGESVVRLFRESLDEIRRIPGVTSAAVALALPYERGLNIFFRLPGEEDGHVTNALYVTPGYFETLRIPLRQGRLIQEADREDAARVIVVDQAWVDAYLPDRPAVGFTLTGGYFGTEGTTIVGVVGNVQQSAGWGFGGRNPPVWETPTVYFPAAQAHGLFGTHIWFAPSWIVSGEASQAELAAGVTRVFRQLDPDLPVARVVSLPEVVRDAFSRQRFEATFLLAAAGLALVLAGIGLYGIVAHEVLERRTEMGLRMALGATPGRAVWAAGAGGLRLSTLGLIVGGGVAVVVARIMESLIWGVAPYDPATLASLLGVLALFAAVASFVPAARVGRMNPARILREG